MACGVDLEVVFLSLESLVLLVFVVFVLAIFVLSICWWLKFFEYKNMENIQKTRCFMDFLVILCLEC